MELTFLGNMKAPTRKIAPQMIPPPDNSHPENFHLKKFRPRISPTLTIPTQENSHPENSNSDNSHPENSHTGDSHLEKFSSSQLPPRIIATQVIWLKWVQ